MSIKKIFYILLPVLVFLSCRKEQEEPDPRFDIKSFSGQYSIPFGDTVSVDFDKDSIADFTFYNTKVYDTTRSLDSFAYIIIEPLGSNAIKGSSLCLQHSNVIAYVQDDEISYSSVASMAEIFPFVCAWPKGSNYYAGFRMGTGPQDYNVGYFKMVISDHNITVSDFAINNFFNEPIVVGKK